MQIAQIAPLAERVPPELYGGTERVVSALTEELVRRGHRVTLFASGDSRTGAELVEELEAVQRGLMARRSTRQRVLARLWPASLAWSGVPLIGRWLPGGGRDSNTR